MSLHVAPNFELPVEAVTETFAILAVKRAGKSNAAVVMAEEMYDAGLPWVAVDPKGDWWGVRAAGDGEAPGLSVLVMGGMHGDVPLEPTAGRLVADLIAEQRLTCVLDVSEMSKADQRRFLTDFADRLYRRNTEPLHVFCEEADEYIPQRVMGDSAKLVGAFETLVKRGGFRGIGITLITQRSASLNKDVLTQAGTLIAMRTPSPQDRKAVLAWIDYHAASKDVIDELPTLAAGEAWVFSPQWLDVLTKIRFRRRRTFDSGATPKVGGKPRPPARLADVDLAAIKEQMAETIERAKADDPKELRRRITELERNLSAARAEQPAPEPVTIEVSVLTDADRDLIERLSEAMGEAAGRWSEVVHQVSNLHDAARRSTKAASARSLPQPRPAAVPARAPAVPRDSEPDLRLRKGAVRMVTVLGQMAPLRLTTAQWATMAKVKRTGGTWSTYLGEIRRLGLVEENETGWTLTDAGFDYIGGRPAPMDAEELRGHYRSILRAGAVRMLDALIDAHPNGFTRDELANIAEITLSGGTFSTYLGDLTRNGLADKQGDLIVANDVLFLGATG